MATNNGNGTVTVVKGDTLYSIASTYKTTVAELARLNPSITNVNSIYVGQVIRVSSNSPSSTKTTAAQVPVVDKWGLVSNSDREVYAGWSWFRHNDTDHYEYEWYYSWGVGVAMESKGSTTAMACTFTAPEHATHVSFFVRAVAKKDKNGVALFATTALSTKKTYWFAENPPKTPNPPTVEIEDYTLTATLDNLEDLNADTIEFHVYQDNGHLFASEKVKIVTYHASCTFTVEAGHDYKVQARAWRGTQSSGWSGYSGNKGTPPAASSGITVIRANSTSSVYLEWGAANNAKTYDIEYTTKSEYFDSSDQTNTVSGISTNTYIKTGLEIGLEYFFRVRAVNDNGHSAWTAAKSIVLGKTPSAPTTWSSTTKAIVGEPLLLYWVHNSEDGSKQVKAELELNVNGEVTTYEIQKEETPEDEEEKTSSYDFSTSGYVEGTTLKWRVRTCGITGTYSEWSIQRVVDIHAKPFLSLNILDLSGNQLETLTSLPIRIAGTAGPNTQKPIGWHLTVTADEGYETVDHIGNKTIVNQNGVVYSEYIDVYSQLDVLLSASNIDLYNNISYTVNCVVTMDSGLTTEATGSFVVGWEEKEYIPNAAISINNDTYSAAIMPYCEDIDGNLATDVILSVYRREFDGRFVEVARNLANIRGTYATDPHPALDYARYRIVATSTATGAVSYTDIMHPSVDSAPVIIQWDEEWHDFDVTEYGVVEDRPWTGSMLVLPYNIDTTEQTQPDVVLVEYIGRDHPVSYYGTQIGGSATWNVDIDATDKATIYALRRLMAWMGDVYVREPSGTGYWANITVSFSQKHCDVVIPVTLNITRVEGGV